MYLQNFFTDVNDYDVMIKKSRDEDPDPVGTVDFRPVGTIPLLFSPEKYKPESINLSLKLWFIRSNFMPTYLKFKYIFFFISN